MNLREYLFRNEMKIAEFARKIEYNPTYINGIVNGLVKPSHRLAKTISLATGGIVPYDGICTKKRGKAAMLEKKEHEASQLSFPEM